MAIRPWRPKPLAITPVETRQQLEAAVYVSTVGFQGIQAATELPRRGSPGAANIRYGTFP